MPTTNTQREPSLKVFVTSRSCSIGRPLLPKLVDRVHDVFALTHFDDNLDLVAYTGPMPVRGDILDVVSMRPAMPVSDVAFHAGVSLRGMRPLVNSNCLQTASKSSKRDSSAANYDRRSALLEIQG